MATGGIPARTGSAGVPPACYQTKPAHPLAGRRRSQEQAGEWFRTMQNTPRKQGVAEMVSRCGGRKLLERVEPETKAGFLAAGGGLLDHACFDALVKTGDDGAQGGGGFVLFSAGEGGGVFFLQRVEARFDAGVAGLFAGAAAHAAFG